MGVGAFAVLIAFCMAFAVNAAAGATAFADTGTVVVGGVPSQSAETVDGAVGVGSTTLGVMIENTIPTDEFGNAPGNTEYKYGQIATVDGDVGEGWSLLGIMIENTAPEGETGDVVWDGQDVMDGDARYQYGEVHTVDGAVGEGYSMLGVVIQSTEPITDKFTITYAAGPYTITGSHPTGFNANEPGTGTTELMLPGADQVTRKGYIFTGWMDDQTKRIIDRIPVYAGTDTDPDGVGLNPPNRSYSLTATWKANEYAVHFNANDATGSTRTAGAMVEDENEANTQRFTYDATQGLRGVDDTEATMTREGYEFQGWDTKANGRGTRYDNGVAFPNQDVPDGSTIELYAQWKAKSWAVDLVYDYANGVNGDAGATGDAVTGEVRGKLGVTFDSPIDTDAIDGSYVAGLPKAAQNTAAKPFAGYALIDRSGSGEGDPGVNPGVKTYLHYAGDAGQDVYYYKFEPARVWDVDISRLDASALNEQGALELEGIWRFEDAPAVTFLMDDGGKDDATLRNAQVKGTQSKIFANDAWDGQREVPALTPDEAHAEGYTLRWYQVTDLERSDTGGDIESAVEITGGVVNTEDGRALTLSTSTADDATTTTVTTSGRAGLTTSQLQAWLASEYATTTTVTDAEGAVASTESATGGYRFAEDLCFVGRWVPNEYVIEFVPNVPAVTASRIPDNKLLAMQNMTLTYGVDVNGPVGEDGHGVTLNACAYAADLTGYTFSGWNTAADGSGDAYANMQVLTEDMGGFTSDPENGACENVRLYAQWRAKRYNVTVLYDYRDMAFSESGQGATRQTQTVEVTFDAVMPLLSGEANGNMPIITPALNNAEHAFMGYVLQGAADESLYWRNENLNWNDAGTVGAFDEARPGVSLNATDKRWTTDAANAVLVARWQRGQQSYAVFKDADNANATLATAKIAPNDQWTDSGNAVPAPPKAGTGYTTRWYTNAECTEFAAGGTTDAQGKTTAELERFLDGYTFDYTPATDLTFWAKTTPNEYTVMFHANWESVPGGQTSSAKDLASVGHVWDTESTIEFGESFDAVKAAPRGYAFGGWNTKPDGTGTQLADADDADMKVLNLAGGATDGDQADVYAVWTPKTYRLAGYYKAPGDTGEGEQVGEVTATFDAQLPAAPATFKMPAADADEVGGQKFLGYAATINGSKTLFYQYAKSAAGVQSLTPSAVWTYDAAADEQPVRLEAVWSAASECTLNLHGLGAAADETETKTITAGTPVSLAPTKDMKRGHHLLGWDVQPKAGSAHEGATVVYKADQSVSFIPEGAELHLYAVWEVNRLTVTFGPDDGTVSKAPVVVEWDESGAVELKDIVAVDGDGALDVAAEGANFTKTGHHLTGWDWYKNAESSRGTLDELISAVNNGETGLVAGNMTARLLAAYAANEWTVEFKAGDGAEGADAERSFHYSESEAQALPAAEAAADAGGLGFSKAGHSFTGWMEAGGTAYVDRAPMNLQTFGHGAKLVLTAQWTANTYTVRFHENGGTVPSAGGMADREYTYGAGTGELPANTYTKPGHFFAGWNCDQEQAAAGVVGKNAQGEDLVDGATFNRQTEYGTDGSGKNAVDLWAVWQPNVVKVTFDGDGADVEGHTVMDAQTFTFGTDTEAADEGAGDEVGEHAGDYVLKTVLDSNAFQKVGHSANMDAWHVAGTLTPNDDIQAQILAMLVKEGNKQPEQTIALKADWKALTYTVAFDKNAGDATGETNAQTFTFGKAQTLPGAVFEWTGHEMKGWSLATTGAAQYDLGGSFTVTRDVVLGHANAQREITLHAVWDTTTKDITATWNLGATDAQWSWRSDSGSGSGTDAFSNTATVNAGETMTAKPTVPGAGTDQPVTLTRTDKTDGWAHTGWTWTTVNDEGESVTHVISTAEARDNGVEISDSTEFTAVWQRIANVEVPAYVDLTVSIEGDGVKVAPQRDYRISSKYWQLVVCDVQPWSPTDHSSETTPDSDEYKALMEANAQALFGDTWQNVKLLVSDDRAVGSAAEAATTNCFEYALAGTHETSKVGDAWDGIGVNTASADDADWYESPVYFGFSNLGDEHVFNHVLATGLRDGQTKRFENMDVAHITYTVRLS